MPQAPFATYRRGCAKFGRHGHSLMRAGGVTQSVVRNEEIAFGWKSEIIRRVPDNKRTPRSGIPHSSTTIAFNRDSDSFASCSLGYDYSLGAPYGRRSDQLRLLSYGHELVCQRTYCGATPSLFGGDRTSTRGVHEPEFPSSRTGNLNNGCVCSFNSSVGDRTERRFPC